jgi:protease-4
LLLLAGSVVLNLAFGIKHVMGFKPRSLVAKHHGSESLEEVVVEDNGGGDKIAVLTIDGVIGGGQVEGLDRSLVEFIKDQLDRASEDDEVKAVILKVDSPGGEVLASDEIYRALRDFQMPHGSGKPIIVSMGSLAASGGYYVSSACRWIVANELTITGSIGVIFHNYNYRGLMDKVGVRPDITKSGKLKDMLSGEKHLDEELPEEKAILQEMIDESFKRFQNVVEEGRTWAAKENKDQKVTGGKELAKNWKDFADGRILSGNKALGLGLVDEIGNFDDALDRAKTLVGLDGSKVNLVAYQPVFHFPSFLRFLGKSDAHAVKVDLGLNPMQRLPEGRLYFMSPVFMR